MSVSYLKNPTLLPQPAGAENRTRVGHWETDTRFGTEFHQYTTIERATDARFYFAATYHSWERAGAIAPTD
jgi:IS30 family transposase